MAEQKNQGIFSDILAIFSQAFSCEEENFQDQAETM